MLGLIRKFSLAAMLAVLPTATTKSAEIRLPLRDGKISTASLTDTLREQLPVAILRRFPRYLPVGEIDVRGLRGNLLIAGMNAALGDGCQLDVDSDALIIRINPSKLPRTIDEMKSSVRTFTTVAAPKAAAAQARQWGLTLPATIDPVKPLVILVHGLDSDAADWQSFGGVLDDAGYQTARFDYPADGPIADDVDLFTRSMRPLREKYPNMPIEIVAYSMGSLISRGYIEGPEYAGGVTRLIMIAPPNHGSTWAPLEPLAKINYEFKLAQYEPSWSLPWIITSGLGEAGRDLEPGSHFLIQLNARPRRAGVHYTIIEGSEDPIQRIEADCITFAAEKFPERFGSIPGLWILKVRLLSEADMLRDRPSTNDGPVSFASASLPGVDDVVRVHADHAALCIPNGDQPPAAWDAVHDRLMQGSNVQRPN